MEVTSILAIAGVNQHRSFIIDQELIERDPVRLGHR
jgi:hypothetical protein